MAPFCLDIFMKKIYLASTSPYRRQLLSRLALPFDYRNPEVDEDNFKEKIVDPRELTEVLAREKANAVASKLLKEGEKNFIVIGGDQVSVFNNEILGKPGTKEGAIEQLLKLQGQTHTLETATAISSAQSGTLKFEVWRETIHLTMRPLSREEIERYVDYDKPLDCAGSYKIEGLGISLFKQIEGQDQTAIIGLPLMMLSERLRGFGFNVP